MSKECTVPAETNKGNSKLHDRLKELFKDEHQADFYYKKILGKGFSKSFGDWKGKWGGGVPTPIGQTEPNGEPKLFKKKKGNQYYFKLADGTKFPLKHLTPLRESFRPKDIKEVSSFLLYNYTTEASSLNEVEYQPEFYKGKIMESINRSINNYKAFVTSLPEGRQKDALNHRIGLVEKHKENFRDELIYSLEALGQKVREKVTDVVGTPSTEVAEEDKSGGINITESVTVNPKKTASVNAKIFISQIVAKVKKLDKDGKPYLAPKNSGYLATPMYEDFDTVWKTLEPELSDIVSYNEGKSLVSVYDQMLEKVNTLRTIHPWAEDLSQKLEAMYNGNTNQRYKLYEFIQAFNKQKVNYYVTEFNKATSSYTVLNATATASRENIILDSWGYKFQLDHLGKGQVNVSLEAIDEIRKTAAELEKADLEFNKDLGLASKTTNQERKQELLAEAYREMAEKLVPIFSQLGIFDLQVTDFKALFMMTGGNQTQQNTINDLVVATRHLINSNMIAIDSDGNTLQMVKDGDFTNPFKSQGMFKTLAQAVAYRKLDIAEANILGNQNKSFFAYSNPTYLSNKINEWKKDSSGLKKLAAKEINGNSKWLQWLLASEYVNNETLREKKSQERLNALSHGLANSFTSKGKNDGVDNTNIAFEDQLNDSVFKILGGRLDGAKSYFSTIIAADKSRRIEFDGFKLADSLIISELDNGDMDIPLKTLDIFVKYFEDEYNRMRAVSEEINDLDPRDKIKHYHTGAMNGIKSQIFPGFNSDVKTDNPLVQQLQAELYDENGKPREAGGVQGFTESQKKAVRNAVREDLNARLKENHTAILKIENSLDKRLVKHYEELGGLKGLSADYLVNGLISNIEYTKVFSGDPAFYKTTADLIKRISSTYTDGLQLALESGDDLKFNMATISSVEVSSRYVAKIRASLTDKTIADAYERKGRRKGVNTTDAQAWITPRRWAFLKKRLGQWSNVHDEVFRKMETGQTLDDHELKLAAQPLKGVYFEINDGVPTYLKYSQAILVPSMVKGTPMENLLYRMTHDADGNELSGQDEIHEVITEDGVKVGATGISSLHKGDTTQMAESFELNKKTLDNRGWKLQQDLPIKNMHETKLGTQVQKNILEGLKVLEDYKVDGKLIKGQDLLHKVHQAITDLVNIGKEEVDEKLGVANGKIQDKEFLYDVLIDEFKSRGGNENIILALEKHTPFDSIPQIRGRIDSILMSIFNKGMTNIHTQGGSFIQVSPFGLETFDETSNIKLISDRYDGKGLLPPRKGPDGQTLPGQVMIPHTLAMRLIKQSKEFKNINKITPEQWKELFKNPKTRELVGYRIPNQGMSSNDTLEIVGIMPATMGDSIIGYDGIPAKTGSDFDIDKMYIMAPHLVLSGNSFQVLSRSNSKSRINYKEAKNKGEFIDGIQKEFFPGLTLSKEESLQLATSIAIEKHILNREIDVEKLISFGLLAEESAKGLQDDSINVKIETISAIAIGRALSSNLTIKEEARNNRKKIAQNTVFQLYSDILQSPHTYDNMMTSIDSDNLKDDIVGDPDKGIEGLYPPDPIKNLDVFSPVTQLRTKMEYMSGKMGVALTANQLADHVSNQTLDIYMNINMGIGNTQKARSGRKYVTQMDRSVPGQDSIAHTLSAFLNAYVDIANDPYVTRGNHNDVTANVTFMLIRAGVDLKTVNRIIGQPILKEYVDLVKRKDSITGDPITIMNSVTGEPKRATPYEFLRDKYGLAKDNKAHLALRKMPNKLLEDSIKKKLGEQEQQDMNRIIINAFEFYETKSNSWTDGVLAAKIDTKGGGGSPIELLIAQNKISRVVEQNVILGYRSKFDGTSLDTYEKAVLGHTTTVLNNSELLLNADKWAEVLFNSVSASITKEKFLVSKKLGKATDKAMYTYLMSGTSMMKPNRKLFKMLFEDLPDRLTKAKEVLSDNFLIQELEISPLKGGYNFIGINSKHKPALYENDIYRAWLDLYESERGREIAIDLAKYSFAQSGFQPNLNQFFTHIPHELLNNEGLTMEVKGFFTKLEKLSVDGNFLDQFFRHEAENTEVVPRIFDDSIMQVDNGGVHPDLGFIASQKLYDQYIRFDTDTGGEVGEAPMFLTRQVGDEVILYEKDGSHRVEGETGVHASTRPIYKQTYKLGYKAGKNKIFEYAYEEKVNKSIVPQNELLDEVKKRVIESNVTLNSLSETNEDYIAPDVESMSEAVQIKDNVQAIEESYEEETATVLSISPAMLKALKIKESKDKNEECNI